jgi:LmbE family N-acetylglucosaminyl deacetylase
MPLLKEVIQQNGIYSVNKTVLIVAAHADDEVLGCGGTIARHASEGDKVHIIFMADGVSSRIDHSNDDYDYRKKAQDGALKILGVYKYYNLNFPDNLMDSVPLLKIVQALEIIISNIKPIRIYTHHHGDLNIDHRITHQAVMTACRPIPNACVREILAFEVMSSTEWGSIPFSPNAFIDISKFLSIKTRALSCYEKEMRSPPHSRSIQHIESLARHRGHSVGLQFAEGYEILRLML